MTEQEKEMIITTPAGSDTAGGGVCRDIVPVPTTSSSDNGPTVSCEAGDAAERTTAENKVEEVKPPGGPEDPVPVKVAESVKPLDGREDPGLNKNPSLHGTDSAADTVNMDELSDREAPVSAINTQVHLSWVQEIEAEETAAKIAQVKAAIPMEVDARIAVKRKNHSDIDTDSLESASGAKNKNRDKTRPVKRRISTKKKVDTPTCSAPESARSDTDREAPESVKSTGSKRGPGRPKKETKQLEKAVALESRILQVAGKVPDDIEDDMLACMTAADISATAIEYLQVIDTVRLKCGTMQGVLSGELKRRIQGLGSFIRALQVRAEAAGDPLALQRKIEELIEEAKRNRKEEERKQREISGLRETIKELKQENKQIRIEMRKTFKEIRESLSLDRKESKDRSVSREKKEEKMVIDEEEKKRDASSPQASPAWPIGIHSFNDNEGPHLDDREFPPLPQRNRSRTRTEYVARPPIQGKVLMMPVKNEARPIASTSKQEVQVQRTRPDIKIKSNIQIKPPDKEQDSERRVIQDPDKRTQQDWQVVDRRGKAKKKKEKPLSTKAEKDKVIKAIKNKGNYAP